MDWRSGGERIQAGYGKEPSVAALHHNNKGLKYLGTDKLGKAETHFLKARDNDPGFAAAHNNVGSMLLGRRDLYAAAWEFQRAVELAPTSIEPLVNLGLVFEEADRFEEASEQYRQALQIEPKNAIALGNLARVQIKQDGETWKEDTFMCSLDFLNLDLR